MAAGVFESIQCGWVESLIVWSNGSSAAPQ